MCTQKVAFYPRELALEGIPGKVVGEFRALVV